MEGTWIIMHKERKCVVASVGAPYNVPAETILKHYVASQGMTEKATTQLQADWCPIIKWEGALAEVFTPFSS